MDVERVDWVELQDVNQVDAHQLADLELDGMFLVMEGNAVDGVEVVVAVKIDIQPVHLHREFIIGRLAIEVPTKTWKRACADFIAGKSGNYSCKPATKGPS